MLYNSFAFITEKNKLIFAGRHRAGDISAVIFFPDEEINGKEKNLLSKSCKS